MLYKKRRDLLFPDFLPTVRMIGEKVGSYTILEIVGSGSLGTVYKAEDLRGRQVALKLVRSQLLNSMEKREQFLHHALEASEICHEGICPIYEIGDDNDDFFIVMPFIIGKTLAQYMAMRPLPLLNAVDIAMATGAAVEAIHSAKAVHRGVKPGHIWVLDPHTPSVLLSDCCIGRFNEAACGEKRKPIVSGVPWGAVNIPLQTVAYMSPEQIRGESLDLRTDVFSFGIVLYEMLSGQHPFGARDSLSLIGAILESKPLPIMQHPPVAISKLESILRQALAKNREERYQSIGAMLAEIKAVRNEAFASSMPARTPIGIRKWFESKFRHRV
jgi:eukaryotic-like serine/threonine-protein kinase